MTLKPLTWMSKAWKISFYIILGYLCVCLLKLYIAALLITSNSVLSNLRDDDLKKKFLQPIMCIINLL